MIVLPKVKILSELEIEPETVRSKDQYTISTKLSLNDAIYCENGNDLRSNSWELNHE